MNRMWVNQPSTWQDGHKYHGKRVLAKADGLNARVWFTDGDVVSMQMSWAWLSDGWPLRESAFPEDVAPRETDTAVVEARIRRAELGIVDSVNALAEDLAPLRIDGVDIQMAHTFGGRSRAAQVVVTVRR